MEYLGYLVLYFLIFAACGYYFFFGGKEKLKRYLFERKSLAEKVEMIIKKDFSPEYARATFYIINDYYHKMCQADWQKFCQERIDPSLDKSSPEYAEAVAPIMNAIAVKEDGYYLRRGMEDMSRKLVRFMPGVNDMISLNYFVEPYKYSKSERLAAKSLAEEALRQKEFEERYERERPIREAREAEKIAAQQRKQETMRATDARLRAENEAFHQKMAAQKEAIKQDSAKRAAGIAKCANCANNRKCPSGIKESGAGLTCGGYIPK